MSLAIGALLGLVMVIDGADELIFPTVVFHFYLEVFGIGTGMLVVQFDKSCNAEIFEKDFKGGQVSIKLYLKKS